MPKRIEDAVKINFMVEAKLLNAIKALASRRHIAYSQILREAVREYVIKELKRERDAA